MSELRTSGYKGWWPMLIHRRKTVGGAMVGREGFVNMKTRQICEPEKGWSTKDLPCPTGPTTAPHEFGGSDELWESLRNKPISGEVVLQEPGRTVIRYK
jgi:hypothetical protein